MWVASIGLGHGNVDRGFDDEGAAERWLVNEMLRQGTRLGVVYEVEGDAA